MSRTIRLTESAEADLDAILLWTVERFDVEQALRYQALLNQALDDIRKEPEGPTSRLHLKLGTQVRSYHIDSSKGRSGSGVKSPRHVIFYTLQFENEVRVLRILHERMRPERYLK